MLAHQPIGSTSREYYGTMGLFSLWLPTTTTTQSFKESKTTIRRNVYNGWQPTNVNVDEWIVVSLLRTYHEMLTLTRLARPNEFQEIYTVVIQNFVLCFFSFLRLMFGCMFFFLRLPLLYVKCSDVGTISHIYRNGQTKQKGHENNVKEIFSWRYYWAMCTRVVVNDELFSNACKYMDPNLRTHFMTV